MCSKNTGSTGTRMGSRSTNKHKDLHVENARVSGGRRVRLWTRAGRKREDARSMAAIARCTRSGDADEARFEEKR